MIPRHRHLERVIAALKRAPVVCLIGARQVGKTTLARQVAAQSSPARFFDLENPAHLAQLADPMMALEPLRGLVILDEIQRVPDLFTVLRVLTDRPRRPASFLVLGSASPDLLRQSSESLAGRIHYHEVDGFDLTETGAGSWRDLWIRGGFPRSFLAPADEESREWRRDFVRTFLERDIPQLGFSTDATTLRRFWTMVAHFHAQIWNGSEIARSLAAGATSVARYLDLLTSALVIDQLPPWFENLGKRQVKAPKVYLRDSGILHTLLGIDDDSDLLGHPKVGASWEGFALQQVASILELRREERFFWATHGGAELDLLVVRGRKRWGVEFKLTAQPAVTRSMTTALEDLRLRHLFVVHAGMDTFPMTPKISAVALSRIAEDLRLE
ncbi:MAG TPA: ATP-binding protein [Thermoanaerobaculia bacterium]|nr:ATP-binding protein [Thermoanaerobaculia bacterium]